MSAESMLLLSSCSLLLLSGIGYNIVDDKVLFWNRLQFRLKLFVVIHMFELCRSHFARSRRSSMVRYYTCQDIWVACDYTRNALVVARYMGCVRLHTTVGEVLATIVCVTVRKCYCDWLCGCIFRDVGYDAPLSFWYDR